MKFSRTLLSCCYEKGLCPRHLSADTCFLPVVAGVERRWPFAPDNPTHAAS
jgi:hypothetical protein